MFPSVSLKCFLMQIHPISLYPTVNKKKVNCTIYYLKIFTKEVNCLFFLFLMIFYCDFGNGSEYLPLAVPSLILVSSNILIVYCTVLSPVSWPLF